MVILMAMVLLCLLLPFTSAYADAPYTLTGTSLSWDQIYNRGVVTQEGLSLSWKAGNAPVDYYDVCFNLYRDAALSEVLSYEPGYDTDYYFERIISNETDNDHSMVFTELTAANCTVTITGYDAECVSVTPGTSDDGKDYVTILYKIRRQDSAPSTPYTLTGTSLSWESVDNIVAWGISQDGLLLNWKDGNAPASNEYLDVCFNLYKDAALSQVINGEPDYNTDYYFKREIFNEIDNNHSMVFTELTAADCTVTITGYNAECVSVTPETQHNGVDYVSILYKIRRQGSAPVSYPIWVGSTQVTSANKNVDLLSTMEKDDLLLVCSVTGNYALAINDQIKGITAKKCLITLNRTSLFEDSYSFIYYLGKQIQLSTQNIVTSRNVYNNYGLTFFFDLFYHECYSIYRRQK